MNIAKKVEHQSIKLTFGSQLSPHQLWQQQLVKRANLT
jgi:hypothetical protein